MKKWKSTRAARAFRDPRYLMEAQELAAFLLRDMRRDGRLMARLCDGELRFNASLSDHAFCALGLLELYAADLDPRHILDAEALADELTRRFSDPKGGCFDTPSDGEKLLLRPKETQDGALPCGNSAAAQLFERLSRLTGEEKWRALSEKQLAFIRSVSGEYPAARCGAMTALMLSEGRTREIVLALPTEEIPAQLRPVLERWEPGLSVLVKTPARAETLAQAAPFTAAMEAKDGRACVYACEDGACGLPVTI